MKRIAFIDLLSWRNSPIRKPLILRGARQVGKTHLVRQFGATFENFVEINFEQMRNVHSIFSGDLEPEKMLRNLSLVADQEIIPGKTLLFLDEIQEAPQAIIALRYFYELMPELHIIAAGSLLDFAIEKVGVPVGRVNFLYLYPLSFIEYLKASGYELLIHEIIEHDPIQPLEEAIHEKYLRLIAEYIAIGGMPEAVKIWLKDKDIGQCQQVHHDIINAYRQDFKKYARKPQYKYLDLIFKETPRLQGERLKFSRFSGDYRKRDLAPCLELLQKARVINKIYHSSGQGIPLAAQMNHEKFKPLFIDVGITQAALGIPLKEWFLDPKSALVNKGALTEAFIGQELLAYSDSHTDAELYYWHREAKGSNAEIDYLIQNEGTVLPVEVKSGKGSTLQSLKQFLKTHHQSPYGIRLSIHNYSRFDKIVSLPLYAVAALAADKDKLVSSLL